MADAGGRRGQERLGGGSVGEIKGYLAAFQALNSYCDSRVSYTVVVLGQEDGARPSWTPLDAGASDASRSALDGDQLLGDAEVRAMLGHWFFTHAGEL